LKINLKNITLLAIDCVNPSNSVKALLYSSKHIQFGKIILISNERPDNITQDIDFIEIEKQSHSSINRFAMENLSDYVETDYMLSIQDDGFIINPHMWINEFYEYDYIGAPWPDLDWCKKNRVGNGGFVLKSKKFLDLEKKVDYIEGMHNDVLVTNYYYDIFVRNGMKYAPIEIASKFSLEHNIPECEYNLEKTFGFHGKLTNESINKISLLNEI
jgi:hypothetical protein